MSGKKKTLQFSLGGIIVVIALLSFIWLQPKKDAPAKNEIDPQQINILDISTQDPQPYQLAMSEVNAAAFYNAGLTGKGVKIGVLDIGFHKASKMASLNHLFKNGQVHFVKDYINASRGDIYSAETMNDIHGSLVLQQLGGNATALKLRTGLAPDASYYIVRTDHGVKESRQEERNFSAALQLMDSLGIRLIHASLGYGVGFDDPAENYIPAEMDGKTTITAKAAQRFLKKGNMILISSAGNNGTDPWKVVSTPADVEDAISVGSTDEHRLKRNMSSLGPDFLPYLKPEISCFNPIQGTSFSAPVITGIVACMLQKDPGLSNRQIKNIIERSGHLYPYGNNFLGYGVPDCGRILKLMDDPSHDFKRATQIESNDSIVHLNVNANERAVVFYKEDKWSVLAQDTVRAAGNQLVIKRPASIKKQTLVVDDRLKGKYHVEESPKQIQRATVAFRDKVVEIIWR